MSKGSKAKRHTRVNGKDFQRSGDPQFYGSNRRLPRPHEGVHRLRVESEDFTPSYQYFWESVTPTPYDPPKPFKTTFRTFQPIPARVSPARRAPNALQALKRLQTIAPASVKYCVQRKTRKEVMFATGKAGKSGIGRGKRWKRTINSQYHC